MSTQQTQSHGTKVEVRTAAGWVAGTIIKRSGRKVLPEYGHGYHLVRFGDGRELAVCDFRAVA